MQNPDFWSNKSYRGQGKSADNVNLSKNLGSFGTKVLNPEQLYIENKSSSYTSYYLNPGNGIDNQPYNEYFSYTNSEEKPKSEESHQTVNPTVSRDPRLQKRSADHLKATVSKSHNVGTLGNQVSKSPSTDTSNQSSSSRFESVKRYRSCSSSVFSDRGNSVARNSSYLSRFSSPRGILKRSPPKNRFVHFPSAKVPQFNPDWKNSSSADRKSSNQGTFKSTTFDKSPSNKYQHPETSFKKNESKSELICPAQLSKESSSSSKFKPAPSTDKSVENLINKLFTDKQQKQYLAPKQKDSSVKTKNIQTKKLSLPQKILRKKLSSSAFIKSKLKTENSRQRHIDCSVSEKEEIPNSTLNDHSKSNEESLPMTLLADSLSDVAANFLDVLASSDSQESSLIDANECAVKVDTDFPVLPDEDKIASKGINPEMDVQSSVSGNKISDDNSLLESQLESTNTSSDMIEDINSVHPAQSSVSGNAISDDNSLLESQCESTNTSSDMVEDINLVHPVQSSVSGIAISGDNSLLESQHEATNTSSDMIEDINLGHPIQSSVSGIATSDDNSLLESQHEATNTSSEMIENINLVHPIQSSVSGIAISDDNSLLESQHDSTNTLSNMVEDINSVHPLQSSVSGNAISDDNSLLEPQCESKNISSDMIEDLNLVHPALSSVSGNEICDDNALLESQCEAKNTSSDMITDINLVHSVQSSVSENAIIDDNALLESQCVLKNTSSDMKEEIHLVHTVNVIDSVENDDIHINNEICYSELPVDTDVNEGVCGNEVIEDAISISVNEVEINNSDGESQNNSGIAENIIFETTSEFPETVTEQIIIDENSEYCIIEGDLNEEDLINAEFIFITDENDIPQLHRISVPENIAEESTDENDISRLHGISVPENVAEESELRHAIQISDNNLIVENMTENESFVNALSEHAAVREHFVLENNSATETVSFSSTECPSSSDIAENVQPLCSDPINNSNESLLPETFTNADMCESSQMDENCTDSTNDIKESFLAESFTNVAICDAMQLEQHCIDSTKNAKELLLPESFTNDGENVKIEQNSVNTTVNSKQSLLPESLTNDDICESLDKIFSENISLDKNSNVSNCKNMSDVCEELCFNLEPDKVPSSPTHIKMVSETLDAKTNAIQSSERFLNLDSDLCMEGENILSKISNEIHTADDLCFQEPLDSTMETINNLNSDKLVEGSNNNNVIAVDPNILDKNVNACNTMIEAINDEENINKCDLLNKIKNKLSLLGEMEESKISSSKAKKTIQPSSLKISNINNIKSNRSMTIDNNRTVSAEKSTSDLTTIETKSSNDIVSQDEEKIILGSELLLRKTGKVLNVTYNTHYGISKKTVTPSKVNEISKINIDSSRDRTIQNLDSNVLGVYNLNTSGSDSEKNSLKTPSLNSDFFQRSSERDQNHKRKAEDSATFSGKVAKKSIPQSNANQSSTRFSGTSPSSSCTVALKTFKKPFTAAKKSFVESREQVTKNVALKTVVKKPSFPKSSCKSLVKNHQAKKSAGSSALNPDEVGVSLNQQIANIMQQGYTLVSRTGQKIFVLPSDFQFKVVPNEFLGATEELSEEESRTALPEVCSPAKDIMKFKSSCSCVAEEIPCLCNDEKLQETCEAEDTIDEKVILCTNKVSKQYLLTPSSDIRHRAYCDIHFWRLRQHHCCPKCGIFCTQGKFVACTSEQPKLYHLFHLDCFLVPGPGLPPGCPHCCEFSNFNMVHLLMRHNAESNNEEEENNMKTMTSITENLENCKILMKIITESQSVHEATGFAPSKQELQSVVKSLVHDKTLRLRPTGKCLYNPIKTGDVKKVVQIIANGVSPNHRFRAHKNNSPLHIAATHGFVGIIHVLLQAGALIDACNDDLETPLFLAVDGNHLAAVKYLMYAGAQMNVKDETGLTAFHRATKNGFKDVAQFLYDTGCFDINLQDNGGWTPLVWTCEHKHTLVVRWLLELGADPNIHDKEENTALHWTAYSGESKIAEELLDYGCNISFVNQRGDSALHIAARENNFDCIKLFLIRGAALDTRNKENKTAIMCCQEHSASWNILNQALGFAKLGKLPAEQNVVFKDISRGTEFFPIQAVNEVDDEEFTMEFQYVLSYCDRTGVDIVRTVNSMRFCYCKDECLSGVCMCAMSTKTWYDESGCLLCDFDNDENAPIFECNKTCHCPKTCSNRVVQKGIRCPLQLFRTRSKGWGVRSLKDLPKGAFVCEYVGEIISEKEAEERGNDTYFFDLESQNKEYFVDGRHYGNVSRFFNHSCEPNLVAKKVYIDHQDLNFPRIAFFTKRATSAYEELCFDYGIDFWIVKSRSILCTCNSTLCKYSKDSIDNTIQLYLEERSTLEASISIDDA